jgi:hypothetical protein
MPKKNTVKTRFSLEKRSAANAQSDASAAVQESPPQKGAPKLRRLKPHSGGRKRVRLGDALRQRGLDEHTMADNYVGVIEKLKEKTGKSGGVEKLLVDVLKECSRHLEPVRAADQRSAGDMPVHVHLVHNVARPERRRADIRE